MAWRKVWKAKRQQSRRHAWLLRWYDDFGAMRAKTFYGDAKAADEECRRLELELNDGTLGRRREIEWLTFVRNFWRTCRPEPGRARWWITARRSLPLPSDTNRSVLVK